METLALEDELLQEIGETIHSPLAYAQRFYPWGQGDLEGSGGPRTWQADVLKHIGAHLQNPKTRNQPCLVAICSGHDIGKSALISMLTDWAMSTCEDCRVIITADTAAQLATKTAPEAEKWFRMSVNAHWWNIAAKSIKVKDPEHERTWRADFIPWSANRPQAFAGLHNKGKRILIVFDEASEIDEIIWETVSGVLGDEETEIIWIAPGNPTKNTGRFAECFGRFKHRWKTFQIDSRTVEGVNKVQIEKDIEDWGEDSDFVRVRWRGEFPRRSSNQFIGHDVVAACRKYHAQGYESLPKILAVDVARFGDDQTVFACRQGRKARILEKLRGKDTVFVAERTIQFIEEHEPDAIVVDGDGLGAGTVDQLRHRGFTNRLFEFHGGVAASDAAAYFNRRAECWGLMRDWLASMAEIPDDPELETDLTSPEYGFSSKQQIQLEKKEDMKKRGLASPDCGDALAMTFAVKVAAPKKKVAPAPRYPGQDQQSWMS